MSEPLTAEQEDEVRRRCRGWSGVGLPWQARRSGNPYSIESLLATLDAERATIAELRVKLKEFQAEPTLADPRLEVWLATALEVPEWAPEGGYQGYPARVAARLRELAAQG